MFQKVNFVHFRNYLQSKSESSFKDNSLSAFVKQKKEEKKKIKKMCCLFIPAKHFTALQKSLHIKHVMHAV